jgi:hypothetical protein
VVGNDHADAAVAEIGDDLLNVVDRDRVDSGERLVEEHEAGPLDERARDLQATPLSTGERVPLALAEMRQREIGEQVLQALRALLFRELHGLEDGEDVLLHRELPEDRRLLGEISDAHACPPVHRDVRQVLSVQEHPPSSGGMSPTIM